jgi:hypothetical protein
LKIIFPTSQNAGNCQPSRDPYPSDRFNRKTLAQAIAQTHTLTLESSQKIALQSQFFSNPKSALFA